MRVYVGGRKRIAKGLGIGAYVPVRGNVALALAGSAAFGYLIWMGGKAVINMAGAAIEFIGGVVAGARAEVAEMRKAEEAERMERAAAEREKAELAAGERVAARGKALCEEFFEIK
jgi:hypothetical protein